MSLVDQVRAAGVVGAGGGGFPTHVKLAATADTLIANGAECEPLLHKDAAIMEREAALIVQGMLLGMEAVGAATGIIGIKAKNRHAVAALRDASDGTALRVHELNDVYPAGDEFDLVYETTRRVIPAGGIPLRVGVVVCNVETLANIARAAQGVPVTHKVLTVAGAVRGPATFAVPLGTSLLDCIVAAGGATVADPVACVGGVMMGQVTEDFGRPVTKTTGGIVVLSREHPLMARKLRPAAAQHAIGKSACDQCRFCTELCPRYLLGHPVEPHQVMRSLAFTASGEGMWNAFARYCCACGLCTLFACPEQLYPKEACDRAKVTLRAVAPEPVRPRDPHPMRDGRHVPIGALMRRLELATYEHPAPWRDAVPTPRQLVVSVRQGAGAAGTVIVSSGQRVSAGQALTALDGATVGAIVHAPCDAVVAAATPEAVTLETAPAR